MKPDRETTATRRHVGPRMTFLALLVTVSTSSCGDASRAGNERSTGSERDAPQVAAVEVKKEDLTLSVTMPGSVMALESADLLAGVGGYVEKVAVDIGDEVESGQVLAVVSVPEMLSDLKRVAVEVEHAKSEVQQQVAALALAKAALAVVESTLTRFDAARDERVAQLAFRQSELDRWKELLAKSPAIERRKLDEAQLQMRAAQAALALVEADLLTAKARVGEAKAAIRKAEFDEAAARARVSVAEANHEVMQEMMRYSEIRAPFAGVITARHVHPGAFVQPATTNSGATPLLRIERVDRVRVRAEFPMDTVAALDPGDPVVFGEVATAPGERFEGTITRTAGALGERSRMMRAEVELDNPKDERGQRKLCPGSYGSLTVVLEAYPATPIVPATAVFSRGDENCVFAINNGTVQRRAIKVVFRDGSRVGVGEGVSVGQLVVASDVKHVEDGQLVRTKPSQPGVPR